jgi:signal peptidase I
VAPYGQWAAGRSGRIGPMRRRFRLLSLLLPAVLLAGCSLVPGADEKRYRVDSGAMEPAIKAGQTVRARVVKPGTYQPKRGDIVVFNTPERWRSSGGTAVKRVIGIPGDVVACCAVDGRVIIDGQALDEPYLGDNSPLDGRAGVCDASRRFGPVTVAPGQLFVMGDNRLFSVDSRCDGPVPVDRVIGVVIT